MSPGPTCRWIPAVFMLLTGGAAAHEMRPALLELEERADDHWSLTWKVPARGDLRLSLDVRLPEGFEWVELPSRELVDSAFFDRGVFHLPGGLDDREIYIEGLLSTFTDAMVQIRRLDGTMQTARLEPSDPALIVEARPSPAEIPKFYFGQGLHYLAGAWDHAALLLVLLLVCGTARSGVVSAGCFLAGMVAASAFGTLAGLPASSRWIEIMVALSLLPPALAVVRTDRPEFVRRFPTAFATLAGLVHGASLLSVFALAAPTERSTVALAAFLSAVLLGLAAFAIVANTLLAIPRRPGKPASTPRRVAFAAAYTVGICAVVWTLQRW